MRTPLGRNPTPPECVLAKDIAMRLKRNCPSDKVDARCPPSIAVECPTNLPPEVAAQPPCNKAVSSAYCASEPGELLV